MYTDRHRARPLLSGSPPRPSRMKKLFGVLLVALLGTATLWRYGRTQARSPGRGTARRLDPDTVILVCIDACRRDTFTHADEGGIADRLTAWSRNAYRLQNALSTTSWTVPGVGSLMTGRYPVEHGAGNFRTAIANVDDVLPSELSPSVETIFERLRADGYATAAWVDTPWLFRVGLLRGITSVEETKSDAIIPAALRALSGPDAPKNAAFYLHLMDVHDAHRQPLAIMRAHVARYDPRLVADWRSSAPAGVCENADSNRCLEYLAYAAAVRDTREQIASLLDGLRTRGRLGHAAIIVLADHGEAFGEHAGSPILASDPRLTRGKDMGHGQALYETLLDIPMYIWTGEQHGTAITSPASLIDVAPTLAELCRLPPSAPLPGLPLSKLQQSPQRSLFASGVAYGSPQFSVRSGRWKRIASVCPPLSYTFDLENDPQEKTPAAVPDDSRTLDAALLKYTRSASPPSEPAQVDGSDLAKLRSLGYLTGTASGPAAPCSASALASLPAPQTAVAANAPHDRIH